MDYSWLEGIVAFAKRHEEWVIPVAFFVGGAESIIGLSIVVPSTAIFLALASVGGLAGQNLPALWLAAGLGASAGDWLSYGMGYYFEKPLRRMWPLSRRPELIDQARAFFERWGVVGLFLCRFLGPARSVVMLTTGIVKMPAWKFAFASLVSGLLWAAVVLIPVSQAAKLLARP